MRAAVWALAVTTLVACGPVRKRGSGKVTLAVLPAESNRFPRAARAITDSLASVDVSGIDRKQVAKVSLEVVQLSIECVEPSVKCYAAVGKSLSANRLLFARLARAGKKQVKVTVTFFDVDTRAPKTAQKVFASEQDVSAGVADLVSEATR